MFLPASNLWAPLPLAASAWRYLTNVYRSRQARLVFDASALPGICFLTHLDVVVLKTRIESQNRASNRQKRFRCSRKRFRGLSTNQGEQFRGWTGLIDPETGRRPRLLWTLATCLQR